MLSTRNQRFLFVSLSISLLIFSIQHSPALEAKRFSASQEISRTLRYQKVHCCMHTYPSPVPILGQLGPVHAHTSHVPKIHLNIILSTPGSSKLPLSLRFPNENPVYDYPLLKTCYMHRSSHSSRFNHPISIG